MIIQDSLQPFCWDEAKNSTRTNQMHLHSLPWPIEVLRDLDQRRLTPAMAARLLGLERRQVFRLLKVYRAEGAAGLISKKSRVRRPTLR